MKLPNDLIKATNYEKAKDREIHEFECINGRFIHHYVLGGERELTEQEIVDCLNALATLDCDLSTAYAFVEGQNERIKELEEQLSTATMCHGCEALVNELKQENQQLKEKYDNLYKCYQKTSQEDLKDKYDLAEENEELKAENKRLKEKISTQLQNNADNVDFMENQRREIEQLKQSQNQKAIEELKKIKNYFLDTEDWLVDSCAIEEFIINQLKELEVQA